MNVNGKPVRNETYVTKLRQLVFIKLHSVPTPGSNRSQRSADSARRHKPRPEGEAERWLGVIVLTSVYRILTIVLTRLANKSLVLTGANRRGHGAWGDTTITMGEANTKFKQIAIQIFNCSNCELG